MKSERKKHFAVDKLSSPGRELVDALLAENETYDAIVAKLKEKTGETLARSSLQSYHARKWFPTRRALEETNHLYGLVKDALKDSNGKNLDEVTSEAAKAMLFKVVAALKDPDPYALYDIVLADGRLNVQKERNKILRERTDNDQKKITLLERQVVVREKQLEQMKETTKETAKKVDGLLRSRKVDPEIRKVVREQWYGLVDQPAGQAD